MMRPPAAYFVVSAAAHAAVFASLSGPGTISSAPPLRPLVVRLAQAPEMRPVLPAAAPAAVIRREPRPIMQVAHAASTPARAPIATPAVAPATAAPTPDPVIPPAPATESPLTAAPAVTAAPLTERIALQRPVVPVAVTDTTRYPDPVLVAGYARTLSDGVARVRRYPPLARMRGWQGTAVVNVTVGAQGEVLDLKVTRSSGHDVLDQQALTMIREAQPLPPAPEALRGLALVVQLPVTFSLSP